MVNSTSSTFQMKRKILTFTNKISRHLSKPEKKFVPDITYGMLVSGSCLLTDVVDQLDKPSKKINIVDRLSRHLGKGIPALAAAAYFQHVKKMVPAEPVIHIDDSDVVKPDGHKFEVLDMVSDIVNITLHFSFTKPLSSLLQGLIVLFPLNHRRQASIG